jgi:hypothetical protein
MEELAKLLQSCDIDFDPLDRRIMCFPHIMNICVQHVIANFTNIELAEAVTKFVSALPLGLPNRRTLYNRTLSHWDATLCRCSEIWVSGTSYSTTLSEMEMTKNGFKLETPL